MALDFSRARLTPFAHQREDVQSLIDHPFFFITSEMRTGKTKIVIDAAQFLFEAGTIDRVIVVAPNPVRNVWFSQDFGELQKHLWSSVKAEVREFHAKSRIWLHGDPKPADKRLVWVVTNYEFIRSKQRLFQLLQFATPKTLLVLDESSFIKNWEAQQTKACRQLRKECGRVVELNGTPLSQSPLDLFAQGNILDPSILECKFITHYKARYAIQAPVLGFGGKPLTTGYGTSVQKITGWTNLEDIQKRFAPYTVRRLQKDCLDLPPKLDPVTLTAELTSETWRIYKEMRDELVVWLKSNVATASTAAIKTLRLAQITSGFLGGIESSNVDELTEEEQTEDDKLLREIFGAPVARPEPEASGKIDPITRVQEIGREKLDVLLWILKQRLESVPNFHVVTWCRFRPELTRMLIAVAEECPQFTIGAIHGDQKKGERSEAMSLLHPDTSPKGPVFVGGTFGTGSYGLNFTAANTSINMSFDFSLGKFLQSGDRIYGPGMIGPAAYFDIIAVGPNGQKTIDHHIVASRRNAENIATWTTSAWIKKLLEE